jgi:2-polyprenyl-6-methoxyphenol hydroxylase-like FAD-dependent oxidoreductase
MSHPRKAIVAGGSMAGMFAANLLHRAGWQVDVYERVAGELEGRGAGIVAHPELLDALAMVGVTIDDTLGVRVEDRVTLGRDGSVVAEKHLPQVLTAWSQLYHVLRQALPPECYHSGKHVVDVAQDAGSATAYFMDGTKVSGDLIVGADGIRSGVRPALLPEVKAEYAGYVAWRGLVEERELSPGTHRDLFPYFAFCLPQTDTVKEQILSYPVAGKDNDVTPGRRRYNFVWYRATDEAALAELSTDATGKTWSDGIPPPLIRPEVLQRTRDAADATLAPQFAELVHKTPQLFFQPIYDLASPRIAFDRIALIGDAAFVARPHCGMGVTKAAADAVKLVEALSRTDDIPAALRRYEDDRLELGRFIVGHARALGTYMQARLSSPEEFALAERYSTTEAIMDETAVSPEMH